jgi:hypothetical protein
MEDIWFGLETKVRALMKELLEPTIRRVIESKETTEKILKTQETFSTRIDDIDMNVGKYSRKIGSIDEISKKNHRIRLFNSPNGTKIQQRPRRNKD